MSRVGLQEIRKCSIARNSPSITSTLRKAPNPLKVNIDDIKSLIDSPLIGPKDKENVETQTDDTTHVCSSVQTEVTISETDPDISAEDLTSEEPTVNYWRALANRLEEDIDEISEKSFQLSAQLGDSMEEIREVESQLETLREVLQDLETQSRETEGNDEDDEASEAAEK
ncbi:unnamed protein product [Caenorhabditis auriculariae]|uniref:Geminin n=1 Tax=Caenorhabditis auriculariae TaxID=2777116 RepID=A0A8S1GXM1_9PELO|nr:unnamed protein product [Caenorhabditis auriculariae]